MNLTTNIEAMFQIPEGHTPKVIIGGGTNAKNFTGVWKDIAPDEASKDMDENSSKMKLPLSPVLVLLIQGEDGHIDTHISLPLQKWQALMKVEKSVDDTNDMKRITDWCAGFMHGFCASGTIAAYDLATNQVILGEKNGVFDIESVANEVAPKKEARFLESIGSADDILKGLFKPEKKLMVKDESPKAVEVPIKNLDAKKQQQDIKDKYGIDALKDMLKRTKKPLLLDD